jgi:hypothetical protein
MPPRGSCATRRVSRNHQALADRSPRAAHDAAREPDQARAHVKPWCSNVPLALGDAHAIYHYAIRQRGIDASRVKDTARLRTILTFLPRAASARTAESTASFYARYPQAAKTRIS